MAPLRYTAKFDPFLSLDCARVQGGGTGGAIQGEEGIKFCHLATLAFPHNDYGPSCPLMSEAFKTLHAEKTTSTITTEEITMTRTFGH